MALNIAIVEETSTIESIFANLFKGTNHSYSFFHLDSSGLEPVKEMKPDVIIFPGFPKTTTSSELLHSIRSTPELKSTHCVLSTSIGERDFDRTIDLDPAMIDGILLKPFDKTTVLELLDKLTAKTTSEKREKPLAVVIDDSTVARQMAVNEMKKLGFDILTASDGDIGLKIILDTLPDIVLTDIEMPKMSGLELCKELTTNPITSQLPIVVISGTISDREIREGFNSGAINFLAKPFNSEQITDAVNTVMGRNKKEVSGTALIFVHDNLTSAIIGQFFREISITSQHCKTHDEFMGHIGLAEPDIIVIDLTSKTIDGIAACRALRSIDNFNSTPVVVISNLDERDLIGESLQSGANDFLEKPFTKQEFHARVKNLLIKRRTSNKQASASPSLNITQSPKPKTGQDASILHNVGNILNSLNVTTSAVAKRLSNSAVSKLDKTVDIMKDHKDNYADFFINDEKGKLLPDFFESLCKNLKKEHEFLNKNIAEIQKLINHLKDISNSPSSNEAESVMLTEAINDAIQFQESSLKQYGISVHTKLEDIPTIQSDKHKITQILTNLLINAQHAINDSSNEDGYISIRLNNMNNKKARITIKDNGIGIPKDNMKHIFNDGFSTKNSGHGYGLHSSANYAKQLGGSLYAKSAGEGKGSTFTLEIPMVTKNKKHSKNE